MSTGLKKWFEEDWVDIGAPKKVVATKSVVVNLLKAQKENTLNVSQQLKQHACRKVK